MLKPKCKKCGGKRFWKVRRNRLKCKKCHYEFKFKIGRINLVVDQWRALLKWFLRCQSINVVVEETRISEYKVLKALNLVRQVIARDIPAVFEGIGERIQDWLLEVVFTEPLSIIKKSMSKAKITSMVLKGSLVISKGS